MPVREEFIYLRDGKQTEKPAPERLGERNDLHQAWVMVDARNHPEKDDGEAYGERR